MSFVNVGIEGATTKKALKEAVKADPSKVYAYGTSGMGPSFHGVVSSLQPGVKLTVVGPDPYRNRKWYATIERVGDVIKVS